MNISTWHRADAKDEALVSCVMATQRNRRRFLQQALRCFSRQTYQNSELIVVDDVSDCAELLADHQRVRCIRPDCTALLGDKLNIGIAASHGNLIVKIDDDDYYHPNFLQTAVSHMLKSTDLDRRIVAWDCFLVFITGETFARFSGHGYAAGGTLCFSRRLWQKCPFRHIPLYEDHWFKRDHDNEIISVHQPESYLLVRHGSNTWRTLPDGRMTDTALRSLPRYPKRLERLMDVEDVQFYTSLPRI